MSVLTLIMILAGLGLICGTGFTQGKRCEVVLSSDVSGSMKGKKLKDSKKAQTAFIEELPLSTSHIGLVVFGGNRARILHPLTSNIDKVKKALKKLTAHGHTPLFKGLEASFRLLGGDGLPSRLVKVIANIFSGGIDEGHEKSKGGVKKIIVLASDGQANGGYKREHILQLGDMIKGKKIRIITIAIGEQADEDLLKGLASTPQDFHKARFSGDLPGLYTKIASGITLAN